MRSYKYIYLLIVLALTIASCEQEFPVIPAPGGPGTPVVPLPPDPGDANFSKFVVLGNSLTAGFQANALFNDGQMYSMGNILSGQFATVGGGEFLQPDINHEVGFSGFANDGRILGRLILAGDPPLPTPTVSDITAIPSPINPLFDYTGPQVNNFSVPGIYLGQALSPETGNPASPLFNPFYWRFASSPGASTLIGDAVTAGGTFFTMWLGNNDVLLYAVTGASGQAPLTTPAAFAFQFNIALTSMTAADPSIQGIVANIPDIESLPYFKLVPWNSIPFEEGDPTIDAVNAVYDATYNAGIAAAAAFGLISPEEAALRTIRFAAGANGALVEDETLTVLENLPDPLPPNLPNLRQANADDLITLSAGAVLGTLADPNNPLSVIGVGVPLGDSLSLLNHERIEVQDHTDLFNASIENAVATIAPDRVALADINQTYNDLVATSPTLWEDGIETFGVTISISAGLAPPTGLFSEDGIHPNSRGYAFLANAFIDAINAKFGANVPLVNIGQFPGTGVPQ